MQLFCPAYFCMMGLRQFLTNISEASRDAKIEFDRSKNPVSLASPVPSSLRQLARGHLLFNTFIF